MSRPLVERLTGENSVRWCELDLAGVQWRAYLVDRKSRKLRKEMGKNVGWTDVETCTVMVGWDLPHDYAESVLFHEIVGHSVLWAYGVALKPGKDHTDKHEERVLNPYMAAAFDALRRSGWIELPPRPDLPAGARGAWKETL